MTRSGPAPAVRSLVWERDNGQCAGYLISKPIQIDRLEATR